jgi:hypothetical protein
LSCPGLELGLVEPAAQGFQVHLHRLHLRVKRLTL